MSDWFEMINKNMVDEKSILIMFPYAGGGASIFRKWENYFEDIKLYAVQYPGRENRFSDKPINDIEELTENIFCNIKDIINSGKPYYLFGHSMGTKVAYEVALKIKNGNLPQPEAMIVSAGKAPCYKESKPICHLDDDGFIEGLKRYGGTPKEILDNRDLIGIFLPMLRADFLIDEKYQDVKYEKIDSSIFGLMGIDDKEMILEELKKWRDYTTKEFSYEYIDGAHMYLYEKGESVAKKIKKFIKENEDKKISVSEF